MISKEELIQFEKEIIEEFSKGNIPYLIHLSGGNEDQLIDIFKNISKEDYVLSTHRSHYHYLLKTENKEKLKQDILNGNSMFVFDKEFNFLSSSILAGTASIAAGLALSIKLQNKTNRIWCFIGDGAEDEGHFYEAVRYVHSNNLPCTFIIEDNDRSVDSSKEFRGASKTIDWPSCVTRYNYIPTLPHAGAGLTTMIDLSKWNK